MTDRATGNPLRGIALALACLVILGIMPVISGSRPETFDALIFAFYLSVWQLAAAAVARPFEGRRPPTASSGLSGARRARTVLIFTGVLFGLSTYLYVFSVEKAGAVSFSIAVQAYPLFATAWETIFLGRRKSLPEFACTAALVTAMYYLGTGGTWRIDGLSLWFLVALCVPLLWSIAHVMLRQALSTTQVTPGEIVFSRVLISTIFLGLLVVATRGPGILVEAAGDLRFQSVAIVMGVVYYLELILWFHAVRHIEVSLGSSITVPAPALTLVLAVIWLGETAEPYQIVTLGVVIVAMLGLIVAGTLARKRVAGPDGATGRGKSGQDTA